MVEMICPKADDCPMDCEHGVYHAKTHDCVDGCRAPGAGTCITRDEAERIKAIADAEDKGFMKEVNDGKL